MRAKTVAKRIGQGAVVALIATLLITLWRVRVPGGRPPEANEWKRLDPDEPDSAQGG